MHQFDRDVLVTMVRSNCYSRPVTANWSINGVPNGGYLLAIMANAMLQCNQKTTTAILTANYLNRCEPGDATVLVDKMATSRQFDRSQATLIQNGEEKIRAFGTFAIDKNEGLLESYEDKAFEITELENCVPVPAMPSYTLFDQLDVLLDPISARWLSGNLSERSESKGWIRFKNERPFDFLSILLIADSFPPAVLSSQGRCLGAITGVLSEYSQHSKNEIAKMFISNTIYHVWYAGRRRRNMGSKWRTCGDFKTNCAVSSPQIIEHVYQNIYLLTSS